MLFIKNMYISKYHKKLENDFIYGYMSYLYSARKSKRDFAMKQLEYICLNSLSENIFSKETSTLIIKYLCQV